MTTLTHQHLIDLIETYDSLPPSLYFATDKFCDVDSIYKIQAQKAGLVQYPNFIVFHPSLLEEIATTLDGRLIHIREYEYKMMPIDFDFPFSYGTQTGWRKVIENIKAFVERMKMLPIKAKWVLLKLREKDK